MYLNKLSNNTVDDFGPTHGTLERNNNKSRLCLKVIIVNFPAYFDDVETPKLGVSTQIGRLYPNWASLPKLGVSTQIGRLYPHWASLASV
jgi:hypothetical protein